MAPPNLPGFYWDPDKNRYFKVQPAKAAPPEQAPWSSTSVKRRKAEAETAKKVRRRKHQVQRNIERSPAHDLWTFSGPLRREIDGARWMGGGDVQTMAWASGLEGKGAIRFGVDGGDGVHLEEFVVEEWVESHGKGLVWATTDHKRVQCLGMQINKNGYIRARDLDFDADTEDAPTTFLRGGNICDQISSINLMPGGGSMIITSRAPERKPCYYVRTTGDDGLPSSRQVVLNVDIATPRNLYSAHSTPLHFYPHRHCAVNTFKLAPSSSAFSSKICGFLATDHGIIPVPPDYIFPRNGGLDLDRDIYSRIHQEIFAVDFQPSPGSGLALAAGRGGSLSAIDYRGRHSQGVALDGEQHILHGRTVSNMKFVNEHQVLAAGPRSRMALYDLRYVSQIRDKRKSRPLFTFPGYNNSAYLDLGMDVSPDGHTAVAAQDDGQVKVFSTSTGAEVACPALEGVGAGGVVKKIAFGTERGDLYVGLGGCVRKFGFGSGRIDCV